VTNFSISFRSALSQPSIYRLFNRMIGVNRFRHLYVNQYICPKHGDSILDIGCGPADILEHLSDVTYIGFDSNSAYIDSAKKNFSTRGAFFCDKVSEAVISENDFFDIVLANGILHHLEDAEAIDLFKLAFKALKPGGRIITHDGCYTPTQSLASRYLLSKDRGTHVRTYDAYLKLASMFFTHVHATLHENLLRIPYTHIILECQK